MTARRMPEPVELPFEVWNVLHMTREVLKLFLATYHPTSLLYRAQPGHGARLVQYAKSLLGEMDRTEATYARLAQEAAAPRGGVNGRA